MGHTLAHATLSQEMCRRTRAMPNTATACADLKSKCTQAPERSVDMSLWGS